MTTFLSQRGCFRWVSFNTGNSHSCQTSPYSPAPNVTSALFAFLLTVNPLPPPPPTHHKATAEANNLAALASSMDEYNHLMEDVVGGEKPYLSEDQLNEKHEALRDAALTSFRSIKKMGGEVYSKQFEEKLLEQIEEAFEHYQAQNASKNIFAAARTPAVLFALMVCFYVVSGLFELVGITTLSWLMNWCLGVAILTLVVWAYVRFSGQYREIGQHIDTFVNTIWEQVSIKRSVRWFICAFVCTMSVCLSVCLCV